MSADITDTHLLRQLELPARYEALVDRVGPEVARLLVDPGGRTKATMQRAGLAVKARGEGLLVPLVGQSGDREDNARNEPVGVPACGVHDDGCP